MMQTGSNTDTSRRTGLTYRTRHFNNKPIASLGVIVILLCSSGVDEVGCMQPQQAYAEMKGTQPRIEYYVCPVCPLCQDTTNNINLQDFQNKCNKWTSDTFNTYAYLARQCRARYAHAPMNQNAGKWRDDCSCRNQNDIYGLSGQCSDNFRLSTAVEAYDSAHDRLKADAVQYNNLLLDMEALQFRYRNTIMMADAWNAIWDARVVENAYIHMANVSEQTSIYRNPIYLSLPHIKKQNSELMALFSNTSFTSLSAWQLSYSNFRRTLIGSGNGSIPNLLDSMLAMQSGVHSENATASVAADIARIRELVVEINRTQELVKNSSFVAYALAYRMNLTEFIGQAETLLQTKILTLTRNQAALQIRFSETTSGMVARMRAYLNVISQEQNRRGCPAPQPLARMKREDPE